MNAVTLSTRTLYRVSWFIVAYTVLIVVWGAWVRLSGSGDGCGDSWPLCNGEVVPLKSATKTLIEFAHRASTALYGIAVITQLVLTYRTFGKGHSARVWSVALLFFTVTEALLGRQLVTSGLVNQSPDLARLVVMPLHLLNTSLLLASGVLTAENIRFGYERRSPLARAETAWTVMCITVGVTILASGAIAALGSHLAPSESLLHGLSHDLSPESHLAVKLRIIHPLLSLTLPGAILFYLRLYPSQERVSLQNVWWTRLAWATVVAILVGILTLTLLAPTWLKLVHLVMANVLVILLTLSIFHTTKTSDNAA